MEISRFGDWEKAKRLLTNGYSQRLAIAVRKATIKNALLLVREIKRGIKSQAPGGQQFTPLAEVTTKRKGSSKALIDTGFLVSSITQKILSDGAFVGLLRTSISKDGESIANIGAVMEFGATINHPSGAVIVIPPRPFLHPTMNKYRDEVIRNYRDALLSVME
ncbi:MAG: phage virion morphogenesis protein [Armatimonadota bacterium]